jgi:hypothetical protein
VATTTSCRGRGLKEMWAQIVCTSLGPGADV